MKTQNYLNHFVYSCDWLSYSVKLLPNAKELQANSITFNKIKGITLRYEKGTQIFRYRVIAYKENTVTKLFTMLFSPYAEIIDKNLMLIELANFLLYNPRQLREIISIIPKLHNMEYNNLSRIDFACDFQFGGDTLADKFDSNQYYVVGKREGSAFYTYSTENQGFVKKYLKQISWGNKATNVKWKLYNKSREIREESNKSYILDYWKDNGLKNNDNIWRLECSIISASKFDILQNSTSLLNLNYIANNYERIISNLFITIQNKLFKIKKNEGYRNKSMNENICFFPQENVNNLIFTKKTPQNSLPEPNIVRTLCGKIVNSIIDFQEFPQNPIFNNLAQSLKTIIYIYPNLDKYVKKLTGYNTNEFLTLANNYNVNNNLKMCW